MKKDFNRNLKGANQWNLRSNDEVQKIINSYPSNWTKKDFRGEGINNSKKILSRKETERPGLKFGHTGKSKQPLKEVYKHSSPESIAEFERKVIDEETFRARAKAKKQRDLMPFYKKQKMYKERHANLTNAQLEDKRERDRKYRESLKNN